MKAFLRRIYQIYLRFIFEKKAIMKGEIDFCKRTDICLLDGSVKENILIRDKSRVHGRLISQNGGVIVLEENVQIGYDSFIGASNNIQIKKGVVISNNVFIVDNNNHSVNPEDRKLMQESPWNSPYRKWRYSVSAPIIICENVWIGQFARINKGVIIGENSIVAAGTIVTKDVPPNSIVAGNPGKIVKMNIQNEPRLIC
jgi:acetyltransferase-like isoleucine patch superfamily enzyme